VAGYQRDAGGEQQHRYGPTGTDVWLYLSIRCALFSAWRLLPWYAPAPTDANEFFCHRASKIDAGNVTSGGMAGKL
jgi:hypothetical protein